MVNSGHEPKWRQIASVMDFYNEAILNKYDSVFLQSAESTSREIVYVFDENVFQFLINPDDRRRKYSAYFHLADWREASSEGNKQEPYWILLNEMTAILTSEYLFSGKLKGQHEKPIYVSAWHLNQLLDNLATAKLRLYEGSKHEIQQHFRKRRGARQDIGVALGDEPDRWSEHVDRLLSDDLDRFRRPLADIAPARAEVEGNALRRARRLARVMAENWPALVGDQLGFITDLIDSGSIASIENQYDLSDEDFQEIVNDARRWADVLSERDDLRFNELGIERHRPEGIDADALTVSMLQYIARNKIDNDKQRLVFVTGDMLLIDSYRDWYSDVFLRSPSEPNIVRSVGCFSPILNFTEFRDPREDGSGAFDLLRAAIKIILFPFNLATLVDLREDPALVNRRFANLRFIRSAAMQKSGGATNVLDRFFDDSMLESYAYFTVNQLPKLVHHLQALERNSFRLGLDLLQRRAARHISMSDQEESVSVGSAVYFEEEITGLVKQGAAFYGPLTRRIIRDSLPALPPLVRYPIWLDIPVKALAETRGNVDVIRWIEELLTSARDERRNRHRRRKISVESSRVDASAMSLEFDEAYLVLVVGAIVWLRQGLWKRAAEYSDGAKAVYRFMSAENEEAARASPTYQELRYLNAVANRFAIGSMHPAAAGGEDIWLQVLTTAIEDLDRSEDIFVALGRPEFINRTQSERAACWLFYASWLVAGVDRVDGGYSEVFARECLAKTVRQLSVVGDFVLPLRNSAMESRLIANLRRQFFANLASSYLIGMAIEVPEKDQYAGAFLDGIVESFSHWWEGLRPGELPAVVSCECLEFARRRSINLVGAKQVLTSKTTARLALDEVLIQAFGPGGRYAS